MHVWGEDAERPHNDAMVYSGFAAVLRTQCYRGVRRPPMMCCVAWYVHVVCSGGRNIRQQAPVRALRAMQRSVRVYDAVPGADAPGPNTVAYTLSERIIMTQ